MGMTPVITDAGCRLELDGERLPLGADPDWRAVVGRAQLWLDELSSEAGQKGDDLQRRRRAAGFADLGRFCEFTGLDEAHTFEAEAGLAAPLAVHLRILDWLESGELAAPATGSSARGAG